MNGEFNTSILKKCVVEDSKFRTNFDVHCSNSGEDGFCFDANAKAKLKSWGEKATCVKLMNIICF